jgi:hypothetical protein
MRVQLIFFLLALAGFACQSDSATINSKESSTDETSASSDGLTSLTASEAASLRQQYQNYYDQLEPKFPLQCVTELNKAYPADAAPSDTAFFVFRERLREIVGQKDIFKLLENVDENIKISFGDEHGLQAFINMWELDSPDKVVTSSLWSTLDEVLALGGTFSSYGNNIRYFEAPYLDQCMPATADPYEQGAIIGAGVRLRSGPGLNTKIIATLSYDVVKFIEETPITETVGGETHPWIKVALMDGTEGFLFGKFYRSPIDFRAGFEQKKDGQWKMVRLLAGD